MFEQETGIQQTKKLANEIRRHAITMIAKAKASHIGSSFSMADILSVLYTVILRITPETVAEKTRDRLILSKGHGCAALYATLAAKGFFPLEWLDGFYQNGGKLLGHATFGIPGIEFSTGSLGHGLPVSCGFALAGKHDGLDYRVFTILSDGECDEGSNWEAALFAAQHKLDNLVAIIDYNKLQALGFTHDVIDLEPLAEKWGAFGWAVREVDGHDHSALASFLSQVPFATGKPSCLIAHTIKGKGVSFMENKLVWHSKAPDADELHRALTELGEDREKSLF